MEKDTIIHIDHQPLWYLQGQSNNIQQTKPYNWKGILQYFHVIIKYEQGSTNKMEDMLLRPPRYKTKAMGTLMHINPFTHDAYKEACIEYQDFKEVFQQV